MQAQKIHVVDDNGNDIPLVSVLTEDGVLIGTTDIDGVLSDVKGARKIALTHVAFKPQLVNVASLKDGRVTMESVDYGLTEIVVEPKPYYYIEYYFRGFSYIGDSLRAYAAGIIPTAHEIQNKYKAKTRFNAWAFGGAANKALAWNTQDLQIKAEKGVKSSLIPIETAARDIAKFQDYYKVSIEQENDNRWVLRNPEGEVGHFYHDDNIYRATLDGGRMQIYANKVNGEAKMQKLREDRNYEYQYTEVYSIDDDGKIQPYNKIMELDHWEYDSKKGRNILVLYLYVADHDYMNDDEFKARSKELNKGHSGDMSLEELTEYERTHNIPALAPEQLKAIQELTKQTGKK